MQRLPSRGRQWGYGGTRVRRLHDVYATPRVVKNEDANL